MLFLDFFERLRAKGLKTSTHEWLALMEALGRGVIKPELLSFYYAARALLVKRETDFDRFDQAFAEVFENAPLTDDVLKDVLDWLNDPKGPPNLTPEEYAALEQMDLEELRRMFEERLAEQTERHDGGNRWVGTGGTSPFGHGGRHPAGVRVGGSGGGGRAIQIATRRDFANYRDDLVLDVRQTQVALRKLRRLVRHGQRKELDMDETIDRTGKNAGDLEIVMRPPRRNQVRLVLMMDAGGSMSPYAHLVSTIFTAASKSSHWKRFEAYYFHNCMYDTVYTDISQRTKKATSEVIAEAMDDSVLIVVGDATMHPGELTDRWGSIDYWHQNDTTGMDWLQRLRRAYPHSVWLNPLPDRWWNSPSCRLVESVFPMHGLTLAGLDDAISELRSGRAARK
ncbi:MAG: hypothetical protein ACI9OJ_000350 [Myxococcota bacterium]|jgi:uncharacterized protein with von Willebrand factor type A (vWA) domain